MGWVLFFDGECAFCSASVSWTARHDRLGRISFAPLQGKLAAEKGFSKFADLEEGTMVLLRESDVRVFTRSDAVIELCWALDGWWRALTIARIVPRSLRDMLYACVAKNRHRLMATGNTCQLPDPELMKRLRE